MLAAETHGRGEPLVLVHGLATTRVIWRRVLPYLAYRVTAIDVPGFGESPPAGPGFVLEEVADAIAMAFDAPFDLVGHSLGGAIAIVLAERHPELVERLVLVAPAGSMPVGAIWGEYDRIVPLRGIDAPVECVAGTGHIPMMERPQAFANGVGDDPVTVWKHHGTDHALSSRLQGFPPVNDLRAITVRLADGRSLALGDVGPSDGLPVMYLHGAIGAPLERRGALALAIETLGVRLLLPQRPGFGGSDPHPDRTLLDFASDLEQVADALELPAFALVGVSAGGPYAIAAGHRLGARVRVAAVASLSPW